MSFDFRRPPIDIIHMPTVHPGMSYIGAAPDWIIRPAPPATVRLFAESDNPDLRKRQQTAINRQARILPEGAIEIRAMPVVLENARFTRGVVQIADRFWLNGASGRRVRTQYEAKNLEPWRQKRYQSAFQRCRTREALPIPACPVDDAETLNIAIELKNGFNYYHFSTETLGTLAHFVDDASGRPITLHMPPGEVKGFVRHFIDTVFPALADRVRFADKPAQYDRVRSVYSHQHYLYAANDAALAAGLSDAQLDPRWHGMAQDPARMKRTEMCSYDTSLRLLREAGLAQIRPDAATPRLIWMGRDEGSGARARGIEGHEPLLEELAGLGFEQVAFENLTPREQIETMHGADILIAPHGAGLANMTYARRGARVIEIGHRQTQMHRWGDFLKCAHVSRCRYDTIFADIAGVEDLSQVPKISDGLRGVRIGRNATDRIIALVRETLDAPNTSDALPPPVPETAASHPHP